MFAAAVAAGCVSVTPTVHPVDTDHDGIADDIDLCPRLPEDADGVDDRDGCPEELPAVSGDAGDEPIVPGLTTADGDQDGVRDAIDSCPDEPEDKDGFEDTDGCPELDNDRDRIPDAFDKCRNDPEIYNAFEDEDGCPDRGFAKIPLPPKPRNEIRFHYNRATIGPDQHAELARLADTIRRSQLSADLVGHATANEANPSRLAAERAKAVKAALVARGVPHWRLAVRTSGSRQKQDRRVTIEIDHNAELPPRLP